MTNRNTKLVLIFIIIYLLVWVFSFLLEGCNTTRPLPVPQNKVVILSGWTVDNPNEIRNFVLMYSTDQNTWMDIKTIFPTNKNNYLDTAVYKGQGYYRWRFDLLSDTSLLSNIGKL